MFFPLDHRVSVVQNGGRLNAGFLTGLFEDAVTLLARLAYDLFAFLARLTEDLLAFGLHSGEFLACLTRLFQRLGDVLVACIEHREDGLPGKFGQNGHRDQEEERIPNDQSQSG